MEQQFFWLAVFQNEGSYSDGVVRTPSTHTRCGVAGVRTGQPTSGLVNAIVQWCKEGNVEGGAVPETAVVVNLTVLPQYLVQ
jgi:hypothetical protein